MTSCRAEQPTTQPPHFEKYPLRPEQLRSLKWMQKQEASDTPYLETALEETVLDALGWRAEVKAEIPVHIRGGVLGDQVGYGKTAITLAMIDSAKGTETLPTPEAAGWRVPTKAIGRCTIPWKLG